MALVLAAIDIATPYVQGDTITLVRGLRPAIRFTYFNMEDPVVGGYTITTFLAKGGMGAVWLAEHGVMARGAVVKAYIVPVTGVRLSTVRLSDGAVSAKAMTSATRKELVSEFVTASELSVATVKML